MPAISPFDELANTYDDDFTTSRIGQLQRKRVWKFLLPLLTETDRPLNILEMNCGTGEDALRLASIGHHVVATDASNAMIAKAKEKMAGKTNPDSRIQFYTCSFDQLRNSFRGQKFDLIFSNFGGLNCIDKHALCQLRDELGSLLSVEGKLFFVVMGRFCIGEIVYFGIRGKLSSAFRRLRRSLDFTINGNTIPVYYYSPATLKAIFCPTFRFLQKEPVGLFIPPTYREKRSGADLQKLRHLERIENKLAFSSLAAFADHFCVVFKKPGTNK